MTGINNIIKREVEKAFVYLRPDGIMQIDLKVIDELNIDDMKEIFAAVKELSNEKKFPTLLVSKSFINIEKETREFFREEGKLYTKADAFVINSVALRMVANFYLKFERPMNPSKLFNTVEEAEKWLKIFQ